MIFGPILFKTEDFRWCDGDGDVFEAIDISQFPNLIEEYKALFLEKLPDFAHYMLRPFTLMTFVHYS